VPVAVEVMPPNFVRVSLIGLLKIMEKSIHVNGLVTRMNAAKSMAIEEERIV